ncbi:hypothetical protein CAPTEDRAFT_206174 [Capitella teleta]|uniref:Endonuclease/exonuclease/phosphatase domain-containing protein n=1 Tax=Capitella teleta TaxID=283909 RepID=R7TBF4_CAPTE|nr:hypothetical protein CAPTEDRAFT_206174 [Capitella teleta]|eukprot:ELT91073.1 hypothetical protein CAPTEDRAFT_206174 [Capitella teleta]
MAPIYVPEHQRSVEPKVPDEIDTFLQPPPPPRFNPLRVNLYNPCVPARVPSVVVRTLCVGLLNTRSAKQQDAAADKPAEIHDLVEDKRIDALVITESWLRDGEHDRIALGYMTPTGYALKLLPRPNKRGGGLALIHSSAIHTTLLCNISRPSFEGFETNISHKKCSICLVAIYRPPSTSPVKFFNEFSDVMSSIIVTRNNIIIVGDFNIHVDTPHISTAKGLISIMDDMNLYQHVHEPTHINGHTLDLMMTSTLTPLHVQVNDVDRSVSSDHFAVLFKLNFDRPPNVKRKLCVRKWKAIDIAALNDEINRLPLSTGDLFSA